MRFTLAAGLTALLVASACDRAEPRYEYARLAGVPGKNGNDAWSWTFVDESHELHDKEIMTYAGGAERKDVDAEMFYLNELSSVRWEVLTRQVFSDGGVHITLRRRRA